MEKRPVALKNEKAEQLKVVVVGGGISGCACAGRLAANGAHVTVVSSALDVVGLPGYGPEVWAGAGGWTEIAETLELLPDGLRWAWLKAGVLPESGEPVLVVDRRAVSIESKRALEKIPGVEFRQGLVTEVRLESSARVASDSGSDRAQADAGLDDGGCTPAEQSLAARKGIEVETAFGEVFRADAVVLAPGLALRGRVEVGVEVLAGGRYGEVPANELCASLEALGVTLEETVVDVGPRHSRRSSLVENALRDSEHEGASGMTLVPKKLVPARVLAQGSLDEGAELGWPDEFPPAPHWVEALLPDTGLLFDALAGTIAVTPDGIATGEYYVPPQAALAFADRPVPAAPGLDSGSGEHVTRLGHRVRASLAVGVDPEGRLPVGLVGMERIRIAGRAAGAESYLDSLRSGVRVADSLLRGLHSEEAPE